MKRLLCGALAFIGGLVLVVSSAVSQPPVGKDGGKEGGKGGPPRFELGQVFPPPLLDELDLTPDQAKALESIKSDLKLKLEKLLTEEQKKKVENFRPRGGPGGGGKGFKEGDKGPKGAKGDKGGEKGEKGEKGPKGDRPSFENNDDADAE